MTDSIKEIKKERLNHITEVVSSILGKLTSNQITQGNIILLLHWILIGLYILFIIFLPITKINVIILLSLMLLHNSINIYYGKLTTCLFVKFERHFYNDLSWWGPNTFIYKLLGIDNRENLFYIQLYNLSGWIMLYGYYFYRLYKAFCNKNNNKNDKNKKKKIN